jgi:hypothetical protein
LAFAKLKALLRKAGRRTVDGLWEFLGQALDNDNMWVTNDQDVTQLTVALALGIIIAPQR